MELFTDEFFMKKAFQEAQKAFEKNEIPVGAIIVANKQIIAKAHNQTEQLKDVTAHAEMLAITAAADYLDAKYLKGCTLYVTLEPCPMCASALAWAKIDRIVIGATDEKKGFSLLDEKLLHPKTIIQKGVLAKESKALLQRFFAGKR